MKPTISVESVPLLNGQTIRRDYWMSNMLLLRQRQRLAQGLQTTISGYPFCGLFLLLKSTEKSIVMPLRPCALQVS